MIAGQSVVVPSRGDKGRQFPRDGLSAQSLLAKEILSRMRSPDYKIGRDVSGWRGGSVQDGRFDV